MFVYRDEHLLRERHRKACLGSVNIDHLSVILTHFPLGESWTSSLWSKVYFPFLGLREPRILTSSVRSPARTSSPPSPVFSAFTVSFSSIASPTHPPWYLRSRFNLMDLSRTIGFCFNNMNLWFYLWLHWHLTNIWPEICFFPIENRQFLLWVRTSFAFQDCHNMKPLSFSVRFMRAIRISKEFTVQVNQPLQSVFFSDQTLCSTASWGEAAKHLWR